MDPLSKPRAEPLPCCCPGPLAGLSLWQGLHFALLPADLAGLLLALRLPGPCPAVKPALRHAFGDGGSTLRNHYMTGRSTSMATKAEGFGGVGWACSVYSL